MLWFHNNSILQNASGQIVDSDTCCCNGGCPECDRVPSAATVEFLADLNAAAPGTGCADGCSDWIAAWDLHLLSQAEVDSLSANWPTTWPQTEPVHRQAGCYYGLFEGLPCGAASMVLQIVGGGRTGSAVATITIGWADGVFVQITCTHAVDPPSGDCVANLTRDNEGVAGVTIGVNDTAGVPCDFAIAAVGGEADMVMTMIA
jgi:hypothetical protein